MSKLKFNAATPLYLSDASAWKSTQLSNALEKLGAAGKPIVLFVHGRGKEPEKSLHGATFTKGLAVHKIELGYDAKVLMFNWDSAFKGFSFLDREVPLSHTQAGAEALGSVLAELKRYQAAHPSLKKPALLVHSMGSIVVMKAMESGLWPEPGTLFSNVVFSQPDADDVGHSLWLERLAARERVYVTFNRDDQVLHRSTDARPAGAHALGLGTEEPLAPHATYVDLSRMGPLGKKDEDHEVFAKSAMNGELHVCQFFSQALLGGPVVLEPGANVESVDREVVYRLKSRIEKSAPCLQQPKLPGD